MTGESPEIARLVAATFGQLPFAAFMLALGLLFGAIAPTRGTAAALAGGPVGVVSHVKVLSDKVADVSSMEAWKSSFIKDGMSDEQKMIAATARRIGDRFGTDYWRAKDAAKSFPREFWRAVCDAGLCGVAGLGGGGEESVEFVHAPLQGVAYLLEVGDMLTREPGFLGMAWAPFVVNSNGQVRNLDMGLDNKRLMQRMAALDLIEKGFIGEKRGASAEDHQKVLKKTLDLMTARPVVATAPPEPNVTALPTKVQPSMPR